MTGTLERENQILTEIGKELTPAYLPPYLKAGGHDLTHVQRMCKIAEKIWPIVGTIPSIKEEIRTKKVSLFLVKLAIWFHNADRSNAFENLGINREEKLVQIMLHELNYPGISREEVNFIVNAVKNHSKKESPSDSALLRILRYCDMLDMGAVGIGRIFAYRTSLVCPPYVPEDLNTQEYGAKKSEDLRSALADILWCLEWEDFLPEELKSTEFVQKRFAFMKCFREQYIEELKEIKIV